MSLGPEPSILQESFQLHHTDLAMVAGNLVAYLEPFSVLDAGIQGSWGFICGETKNSCKVCGVCSSKDFGWTGSKSIRGHCWA